MNKESILRLIEKVGKWEASKMMGLTLTELITKTKSPLFADESYEVLLELLAEGKIPNEYEEFDIDLDRINGIFMWAPKKSIKTEHNGKILTEIIVVYATPYWDAHAELPYNVDYYELFIGKDAIANEEQPPISLNKRPIRGRHRNVEELVQWYKEVYLPGVYDNIMNTILPELRSEYI